MLRTHFRKVAVASLALGFGFASASALAQADGGSADAGSASAFDGTAPTLTNVFSSGTVISGSALAPTDANAPSAQGATARRHADADALAELLRGDNALNLAVGRNAQDFAQHFAQPAPDSGRRLGQAQFSGTQTNADAQSVFGTAPAQTEVRGQSATARAQGDNSQGLALGRDSGTFGLAAPDSGRNLGQARHPTSEDSSGMQVGQLHRSEVSTIAEQAVKTKNALVADTLADSKGKQSGEERKSEEKTKSALVADIIDSSKGKHLGEQRQSDEKKSALVADIIDNSKGKHLGEQRQSEEKTKHALVADAIDEPKGKHLGQLVKTKNALVTDLVAASSVNSAAAFPGSSPASLGDGPSGVLAAAPLPVPEPANWLLLALGLIVLAGRRLMRRGALLR